MPIVASRGREIRELIAELAEPKRRGKAALRLKTLGSRVVPHVAEELGRLNPQARHALLKALEDVDTADARALKKRLVRAESRVGFDKPAAPPEEAEARTLDELRALPPPRPSERPTISRERGEAHLALARAGSRLARKDLLLCLSTLTPDRNRVYCEAAGLIGDTEFLRSLAPLALARPEARKAIAEIAARERITARSKAVKALDEPHRLIVARSIAGL